jgi:hypothetical protein
MKRLASYFDRTKLAGISALLISAAFIAYSQWQANDSAKQDERDIVAHECTKLAPVAGQPDRILCPGNRIITRPAPIL